MNTQTLTMTTEKNNYPKDDENRLIDGRMNKLIQTIVMIYNSTMQKK